MSQARNKKSKPTATPQTKKQTSRKPAKKSTRKATPKKASAMPGSSSLKKWLGIVSVILLVGFIAHLIYLNHLIEKRFDGETWARPSRVYSRPLELYVGLKIEPEQLKKELKLADYQQVATLESSGQFSSSRTAIEIFSHEFHFADHHQAEAKVRIDFAGTEITSISNLPEKIQLEFIQLTPVLIGSYIPGNLEDRLVIDIEDIPQDLIDILLAVEDHRFFNHFGISPISILRALWANILAGRTVQGGSTLTQQLAKNLFLSPERSLLRKINEALMSIMLEVRFEKEAILTAYINEVFLLQQNNVAIHGFALTSKMLFKQPLKHLSKDKLALLVGMVKGPSVYNPIQHPDNALKRRNNVLDVMHKEGLIDNIEVKRLKKSPLGANKRLPPVNEFPAYLDLVKKQLSINYSSSDLTAKGLHVFTAFDPIKQQQLEQGLKNGLKRFDNKKVQSAVIVADYLNGDLLALVGDRETDYPGFNRAILAQRPIGSLIKPMLLYGLLQSGKTLASPVEDRAMRIRLSNDEIWAPQNYDKKLHGEMTLFDAFVHSYNLPFVQLGLENKSLEILTENLQKIHLLKQSRIYPSILLGATLMTPFEVAQMYQVIANSGYFSPLTTIRQVMDKDQNILTRVPLDSEAVFQRAQMIQVQRALIGVAEQGTARYLATRFPDKTVAGKTGTTNDLRDSWFAGFSNRYLTVVWLGDDDNKTINLTGSSGALRVWADVMNELSFDALKLGIEPSLEWSYINAQTGGKTKKNCTNSVLLPFVKGTQPDFSSHCEKNYLENGIQWLQDLF